MREILFCLKAFWSMKLQFKGLAIGRPERSINSSSSFDILKQFHFSFVDKKISLIRNSRSGPGLLYGRLEVGIASSLCYALRLQDYSPRSKQGWKIVMDRKIVVYIEIKTTKKRDTPYLHSLVNARKLKR